jgi:hypothetical protein
MRTSLLVRAILAGMSLLCLQCSSESGLPDEEKLALLRLRERYINVFTFEVNFTNYLEVKPAREMNWSDEQVAFIFEATFRPDGQKVFGKTITYLNFLDSDGSFQFQLPHTGGENHVRSKTRFY